MKKILILLWCGTVYGGWAEKTLDTMTVEEKIGQLCIVACNADKQWESSMESVLQHSPYTMDQQHIESLIRDCKVGGIIFLLKTDVQEFIEKSNHYQEISSLPLLQVQDAEWGLSMRLYGPIRFPRNMTLGALNNEQLLYEFGKEVGRQCQCLGIHINCAPVVDVNNNPRNPVISDRSLGDDPEVVARKALLIMRGMMDGGVDPCAKHFPGHGDTSVDSHIYRMIVTDCIMLNWYPLSR